MTKKAKAVKLCEECNKDESTLKRYNMNVCEKCSKMDKYTSICKTTALKDYKLTENDIANIDYKELKNPHYSCAGTMKLYKLSEIKNAACVKHNTTLKKLDATLEELKERKPKNAEKMSEENVEKRKKGFLRKLQKQNLIVDSDDYTSDVENYLE